MATRKCGNIYFRKSLMAVRKFTNISISKYFRTSVNSIHYSSFASHKKSYGPTDGSGGINFTLLFQQQCKYTV